MKSNIPSTIIILATLCFTISCGGTAETPEVAVTSLTINPTSLSLVENESETLVASIEPNNATNQIVIWSSSEKTLASVDQNGTVSAIREGTAIISAICGDKKAACKVSVEKKPIVVTSVSMSQTEITLLEGQTATLIVTIEPEDAINKTVVWDSSDESVATVDQSGNLFAIQMGTSTITATAGDKNATCHVIVKRVPSGAVDLGLSVFWAECNLGATKPEDCGDYYAWGETTTKTYYSWETYQWCNGTNDSLTKYNWDTTYGNVDNLVELEENDDAAHIILGGAWRMPTMAECRELLENCKSKKITLNGVCGRKYTSKMPGYTDKWIFIPTAGAWIDDYVSGIGSCGVYWIPTNYEFYRPDVAFLLDILDNSTSAGWDRCFGLPIRPVSE